MTSASFLTYLVGVLLSFPRICFASQCLDDQVCSSVNSAEVHADFQAEASHDMVATQDNTAFMQASIVARMAGLKVHTFADGDDECCIQDAWGAMWTCSEGAPYCNSWANDMKRCCPETCNVNEYTESECNRASWWVRGTCTYPRPTCQPTHSPTLPTPSPVEEPTALPVCQGNPSTWNAGYGPCSTYADGVNANFCDQDVHDGLLANQVCHECGQCQASVNPTRRRRTRRRRSSSNPHPPDMTEHHCRSIVDGVEQPQKRLRREIHLWSDDEFAAFKNAVNTLYDRNAEDPGGTDLYPTTYASIVSAHPECHATGATVGTAFLPWHRHLLQDFETVLQNISGDCGLTVPFWNSNNEAGNPWDSVVFDSNRYGMRPVWSWRGMSIPTASQCDQGTTDLSDLPRWLDIDGWCINDGIAANWVMSDEGTCSVYSMAGISCNASVGSSHCFRCVKRNPGSDTLQNYPSVIQNLMDRTGFESMSDWLELGPHVAPHTEIAGGTMAVVPTSPWDPIFFLHHGYVDKLFAWWQQYQSEQGFTTNNCTSCPGKILAFYNEPLTNWLGRYDAAKNCVLVPQNDPRVCLSYETGIAVQARSSLSQRGTTARPRAAGKGKKGKGKGRKENDKKQREAQDHCVAVAPGPGQTCTLLATFRKGVNAKKRKWFANKHREAATVYQLDRLNMFTLDFGLDGMELCLKTCVKLSTHPLIEVVEFDTPKDKGRTLKSIVAHPRTYLPGKAVVAEDECLALLEKLDRGMCKADALVGKLVSTCPKHEYGVMKRDCTSWIRSTPINVTTREKQGEEISRCNHFVDELEKQEEHEAHLPPTDPVEASLCFKCSGALGRALNEACSSPGMK